MPLTCRLAEHVRCRMKIHQLQSRAYYPTGIEVVLPFQMQ